jgi:hypothetical protein
MGEADRYVVSGRKHAVPLAGGLARVKEAADGVKSGSFSGTLDLFGRYAY